MKKSSEYIAESVFNVNSHYTELQNKTKELYFRCLKENRSVEYFQKEVNKIWGNIDHRFMDKQIEKLKQLVWENNVSLAINKGRIDSKFIPTGKWIIDKEYFKLVPESQFNELERDFSNKVVENYARSKQAIKDLDKEIYIEKKLKNYGEEINQVIAYFHNGEPIRHVQLSTYLAMLHNTDLTRAGWNQTLADSEKLNKNEFIIPYHPFSCPHCYENQNIILSKAEVENLINMTLEEGLESNGELLHPNCKCTLSIYWDSSQIQPMIYTPEENERIYQIRQKVNSLTLEKSRIISDMKIQKELGNEAEYDKLNQRRNVINSKIRDLKEELPTEDLQKQVGEINR